MHKHLLKETIYVAVPALVLIGFALCVERTNGPVVTIESHTVSPVPPIHGTWRGKPLYQRDEPDTQVRVILNYQPASSYQKLFTRPRWQELDPGGLVNNQGKQIHYQLPNGRSYTLLASTYGHDEQYLGYGRYAVDLLFALRQVPKSVGEVRLKATFKVEGRTLPINITVRDKQS